MHLSRIRVFQFRNFADQELHFSPRTNLLVGRNGQGKTNLLEAVYLLAYGKSFRTSQPSEMVLHGKDHASVQGSVVHGGNSRELSVRLTGRDKKLLVHGKGASIEEFLGNLQVLAFTNEHLGIVRGAPAERRAFLDRAMVVLYPGHVRHLAAFGRALKQRNALLAAAAGGEALDRKLLDSWDDAIVREGARIIHNRELYVSAIKECTPALLFGGEQLKMQYVSTVPGSSGNVEQVEEGFRRKIQAARDTDQRFGFTTVGPHRDDLKLFLGGKSLSAFGSAGQQRSALLSLYFAQMEIHREAQGFYPVFLVDDVEAELDEQRLSSFLEYLRSRTQVFLTTAKESFLPPIPDESRRFEISADRILTG